MVRDLCGKSYEDWLTVNDTTPAISTSEEISKSESLLAQMRLQVTFTPDTVIKNQRTPKRIQDVYQAAAMTVETITVDKSVLVIRTSESSV